MQELNLPPAHLRLRQDSDGTVRVYDAIRRKWLIVTPEEWVRQHFVNYLIDCKGYPSHRIANEVKISLNSTVKRCDTVIYSPSLAPLAIIEYKAPDVTITPDVFNQIQRYNLVLGVPILMVSNGLRHFALRFRDSRPEFLTEIPSYPSLL